MSVAASAAALLPVLQEDGGLGGLWRCGPRLCALWLRPAACSWALWAALCLSWSRQRPGGLQPLGPFPSSRWVAVLSRRALVAECPAAFAPCTAVLLGFSFLFP